MYKKISGIVCLVIGCLLLYFGYDISNQMNDARQKISKSGSGGLIPKNPITKQVEKTVKKKYYQKVDAYQIYVNLCYIGAPIFLVVGGALVFLGFRKKR